MHESPSPTALRTGRRWTHVSGILLGAGAAAFAFTPFRGPAALVFLGGAVLAMTLSPDERRLAGGGRLLGAALVAAGLAALALGPRAWDAAAFAVGLALVGVGLVGSAAPARDEAPLSLPARPAARPGAMPSRALRGSAP